MNIIEINDPVYGKHIIKEPILVDLINSKTFQRLGKIGNKGFPKDLSDLYFTRLEHSLGVLIILELVGAKLEEKIAGLLHDINHAAFSHTYDILKGDLNEDHQDNNFFSFLKNNKEINDIFKKYNINLNILEDLERYTLLELPAPDTCADRLDYSIREYYYRTKEPDFIKNIFSNLTVIDNKLIFKNKESAKSFASAYMYVVINDFNNPIKVEKKFIFIDLLKRALDINLISLSDFLETEEVIENKIYSSNDEFIVKTLKQLRNNEIIINTPRYVKKRYIDPRYLNENKEIIKLTESDKEFKEKIENYLK
jgi:HD superfamily phosphohydrolase